MKNLICIFLLTATLTCFAQDEIKLTESEFEAIETLDKQPAKVGLKIKKPDGQGGWYQLEYIREGQNGNWDIQVKKIIVLNRSRNQSLGTEVLDNLNNALRTELSNGTITLANAAALLNRIPAVMLYIELGWLEEARVLLNNMTTDANALTAGRKTYILNQIDAAIEKI